MTYIQRWRRRLLVTRGFIATSITTTTITTSTCLHIKVEEEAFRSSLTTCSAACPYVVWGPPKALEKRPTHGKKRLTTLQEMTYSCWHTWVRQMIYVCTYYVRRFACMFVRAHAYMHVFIHVCMHAFKYLRIHVSIYLRCVCACI